MIKRAWSWWMVLPMLLAGWALPATAQMMMGDPVTVAGMLDAEGARPGDQRVLAIIIDMEDKWHINPDEERTDQGLIPTSVELGDLPPGVQAGPVQFPPPQAVEVNYTGTPATMRAYEYRAVLYVPIVVAADASPGELALTAQVTYQACDDRVCLPPRTATAQATLQVLEAGAPMETVEPDAAIFGEFDPSVFAAMLSGQAVTQAVRFDLFGLDFSIDASTWLGLGLLLAVAALGGLLLNLTPCVLPVIPIKIMGLSHAAGSRARCLALGVTMSLGVVAFWLTIGGAIAFIAGFDAINELFQRPWFTLGTGLVIAVMAVAMCGLFAIQLPRAVYQISPRHDTLPGSFGFGIMTAVLSTPCTAPFMGAAAAWAVTQNPAVTLITFAAIGGGMALPYLILSALPQLVERVPRTGPASELVKQVMGLLMLAAAAYFIGVGVTTLTNRPPDPPSLLYWWPVAFLVAAAGGWLAWRTFQITAKPGRRLAFGGLGAAAVALALYGGVRLTDHGPIDWVYYTPERFAAEVEQGNVVVVDFTAEWCLNCKALERNVLYTDRVVRLFDDPRVVPMKVDLTSQANVDGAAMLKAAGRVAIPLLIIYGPDGEERFKSDFYTVEQVVAAVTEARGEGALTMR